MIVTAYTANDEGMDNRGITASGEPVRENYTIAAPPEYEFGTKITIPSLGITYTVTDRGGAIRGDRLDVYMEDKGEALKFGRRVMEVIIERR